MQRGVSAVGHGEFTDRGLTFVEGADVHRCCPVNRETGLGSGIPYGNHQQAEAQQAEESQRALGNEPFRQTDVKMHTQIEKYHVEPRLRGIDHCGADETRTRDLLRDRQAF